MIAIGLVEPSGIIIDRGEKLGSETIWFTVSDVRDLQLALRRCQHAQLEFERGRNALTLAHLPDQSALIALAGIDAANDPVTALAALTKISETARNQAAASNSEAELFDLATSAADTVAAICAEYWGQLLGVDPDDVPGNLGYESLVTVEEHVTASPFRSSTAKKASP